MAPSPPPRFPHPQQRRARPLQVRSGDIEPTLLRQVFLTSTMGRSIRIKHENVLEMQQVTRK
jgi:hypothetical protein